MWKKIDANADGEISQGELVKAFRKQDKDVVALFNIVGIQPGKVRQEDGTRDLFVKMFHRMDSDDSKTIDKGEFLKFFDMIPSN